MMITYVCQFYVRTYAARPVLKISVKVIPGFFLSLSGLCRQVNGHRMKQEGRRQKILEGGGLTVVMMTSSFQ